MTDQAETAPAAPITTTTIKVDTFIDADKALRDVSMTENDLHDAFIDQSGHFYYYASMYAKAERQMSNLKLRLELAEADAAGKIRAAAAEAGEKMTEGTCKERVRMQRSVLLLEMALIEAKEVESTIKGLVEAFRHKKDMLIVRGNISRDEFKAALSLGVGANDDVRSRDAMTKDRLAGRAA